MTTKQKVYNNGVIHVGEIPNDYLEKALQRQRELIKRTVQHGYRYRKNDPSHLKKLNQNGEK